jgi:predicted heme/steroid binding protein
MTSEAKPQVPPPAPSGREISSEELSRHNTELDAWIAVKGKVYDITEYIKSMAHPGGNESILTNAGEDVTEEFGAIHSPKVWAELEPFLVGTLVEDTGLSDDNSDVGSRSSASSFVGSLTRSFSSSSFSSMLMGEARAFSPDESVGAPLGEAQRQQLELDAAWGAIEALPEVVPLEFSPRAKTLCQYELLQELGKGEFAEVQACRRVADGGGGASPVFAIEHISKARIVFTNNMKRTLRRIKHVGTELAAMRILSSTCVPRRGWGAAVVPSSASPSWCDARDARAGGQACEDPLRSSRGIFPSWCCVPSSLPLSRPIVAPRPSAA